MDINLGAALLGGIQGQLGSIAKLYFGNKRQKQELKYNSVKKIRDLNNTYFIILQYIISIIVISYVCIIPAIASFHNIPIETAYFESNGFFLSLFHGSDTTSWNEVNGLVLAPIHIYLATSVIFYLMGTNGKD